LSLQPAQTETLVVDGTKRLIGRATDARSLSVEAVSPRVQAALDKYLLAGGYSAKSNEISGFIDGLYADDLCLIIACEHGDESAWRDLVARYGATVRSAARGASGNEDAAEDLAQSIWAELHGLRLRQDQRPAGKIAYYSGRGSLGGWLRAVVGQLAVDQYRKQSRMVQTEADADFDQLARDSHCSEEAFSAQTSSDPERNLADHRAASDVEAALGSAIDGLAAEDRLLIKLYYFDGLKLREAGAVLGVHEATASRRLARIHTEVRQRVESILMKDRGWTKSETARSLSEAASHLETDLELMLRSDTKTTEAQATTGE
jgi:RNA polymerase sigma-70 factor (ECF subfamily)